LSAVSVGFIPLRWEDGGNSSPGAGTGSAAALSRRERKACHVITFAKKDDLT
jgi:hypothetical protein